MDDKVFIFFFLIPGAVIFLNYLLLRKSSVGKRLFYVLTGLIVGFMVVVKTIVHFAPGVFKGISGALEALFYWYMLIVATLAIAIIVNVSKAGKSERTKN